MAVVENRFVCDLAKPVQAQALKGNVFSLDNLGSRISVLILNNGIPATISGSITANCILPDGSTVNVNGTLTEEGDGSLAYVNIPQSCLLIPGILKIAVKCTSSSVITTLAAIVANVYMTKTDNVITPSQQIIDDWNAEVSAAIAAQNAEIDAQDNKIDDLKSAINVVSDQQLKQVYRSNASGTKSVTVDGLNIPAGTYKLSCDGITTNDTDATTSLIVLRNGTTALHNFSVARNTKTEETVTLASACDNIIFYASNTKAHSDGDTFTYHNFLILTESELGNRLDEQDADIDKAQSDIDKAQSDISDILSYQKLVYILNQNVSGTESETIENISIPSGTYTVSCQNVTSDDTDSTVNRIQFRKGTTALVSFYADRGKATVGSITLEDECDNIILYASNTAAHSTGDTFSVTGFSVVQESNLNNRITKHENDIDDIYEYQTKTIYEGTIAGTTSVNVQLVLKAGNYIISTDGITSEDTATALNRVVFYDGDTLKQVIGLGPRNKQIIYPFTLEYDIDNINFLAAQNSTAASGKAFTISNLRIAKETELNQRFDRIETALNSNNAKDNPYAAIDFVNDIKIITTTHDHCTDQATLDRLVDKGLGAIAISNYYPSHPCYPMEDSGFFTDIPDVIQIPNAEQHGAVNMGTGFHFNSVGSMYATGKPRGETPVGTHDTWQRSVEDIRDLLLFPDGGGMTINHPAYSNISPETICDVLDYDPIVLGMEFFNYDTTNLADGLAIWDKVLTTGRRCYGFAVPDHAAQQENGEFTGINWCGTIVLFVHEATQRECLRAIRYGRFYAQIRHTDLAITSLSESNGIYTITVNKSATIKAIANGQIISTTTGTQLVVPTTDKMVYLRFEVITDDDAVYSNAIML